LKNLVQYSPTEEMPSHHASPAYREVRLSKFQNRNHILVVGNVWERGCGCVPKKINFFSLKFNMVCMFWIVLMCWCQKWFLKNEKTSLACILTWKVIWKVPATTLSNTLDICIGRRYYMWGYSYNTFWC
jgi:hypothetical protein